MMLTKLKVKFNLHNTEKKKMFSRVCDRWSILHFHFISCDKAAFTLAFFTLDNVALFFISFFIVVFHFLQLDACC